MNSISYYRFTITPNQTFSSSPDKPLNKKKSENPSSKELLEKMRSLRGQDEITDLIQVITQLYDLTHEKALERSVKLAAEKEINCSVLRKYKEQLNALDKLAKTVNLSSSTPKSEINSLFNKTVALLEEKKS